MRRRIGGVVAVLLVAAGLLVPAGASATETFGYGPGAATFTQLRASHGYRFNFSENDKGYFFVRVKGHGSTTDFAIHTRPAGDHLVANFGKRGKFDLHFVPFGKPETVPLSSGCRAASKPVWQKGYLVGRAHFRTERGYAHIDIHHVVAAQETWPHIVCEYGHYVPPGHHKEQRTSLIAYASSHPHGLDGAPRSLGFQAIEYYRHAKPADHRVEFVAGLGETDGRVSIERRVAVATDEGALSFPGVPRLPEEIEMQPPAPFSGSGAFLRTRESTYTWSGDLAVRFPGLDPIRLTGPHFEVGVCLAKACLLRQGEDRRASARRSRVAARSTPIPSR